MTHNRPPHILLVCEYWYGTGGWSYEKYFKRLGCRVDVFDYRKSYSRASSTVPVLSFVARRIQRRAMNRAFITYAESVKADAIVVLKGETLSSSTVQYVKNRYSPVLVQWYPDGPFNTKNNNATRESIRSIPLFDIYYIYAKSLLAPLRAAGADEPRYLPFCYDPEMLVPPQSVSSEDRQKFSTDVVFAGTWEPRREWWLRQLDGFDLSIWGNMWERAAASPVISARWRGNAVYGKEISTLFAVSRIHLNFLREQNIDSHNVRTLEIPGFGGFLLTQRSHEQAEDLFLEGKEIACFESIDELRDKIAYYLSHEEERLRIAQAGHIRAEKEHQAVHRLRVIVDDVKQILRNR